jgi:hypothetical protein
MESRRFTKELQAQRQLADQAEASRFTELQARLEALVTQLEQERQGAEQRLLARRTRRCASSAPTWPKWKTSWTARWPAWAEFAPGRDPTAGMPFHHTVFLGTPMRGMRACRAAWPTRLPS